MQVYTYAQAEKDLAGLLDCAKKSGEVMVKRSDGEIFLIKPQKRKGSPLDVASVQIDMTTNEIVDFIRECRNR